ncbi:hypothetical protein [Citricoccus nitrophenolicus]|uniref:hypothetical protein n=1 Tax=Citricoccus nitrophenolicus TaxID=863575 RepID=UPI0031EA61DA
MSTEEAAAYRRSKYGAHGGGRKFIQDLINGTVTPIYPRLSASLKGKGKKVRISFTWTVDERNLIDTRYRAEDTHSTRSAWIKAQLFSENPGVTQVSSVDDWDDDYLEPARSHKQSSGIWPKPSFAAARAVGAGAVDAGIARHGSIELNLAADTRSTLETAASNAGVDIETLIARRLDELARLIREVGPRGK